MGPPFRDMCLKGPQRFVGGGHSFVGAGRAASQPLKSGRSALRAAPSEPPPPLRPQQALQSSKLLTSNNLRSIRLYMATMPAPSEQYSMSVVRGYTSTSDVSFPSYMWHAYQLQMLTGLVFSTRNLVLLENPGVLG